MLPKITPVFPHDNTKFNFLKYTTFPLFLFMKFGGYFPDIINVICPRRKTRQICTRRTSPKCLLCAVIFTLLTIFATSSVFLRNIVASVWSVTDANGLINVLLQVILILWFPLNIYGIFFVVPNLYSVVVYCDLRFSALLNRKNKVICGLMLIAIFSGTVLHFVTSISGYPLYRKGLLSKLNTVCLDNVSKCGRFVDFVVIVSLSNNISWRLFQWVPVFLSWYLARCFDCVNDRIKFVLNNKTDTCSKRRDLEVCLSKHERLTGTSDAINEAFHICNAFFYGYDLLSVLQLIINAVASTKNNDAAIRNAVGGARICIVLFFETLTFVHLYDMVSSLCFCRVILRVGSGWIVSCFVSIWEGRYIDGRSICFCCSGQDGRLNRGGEHSDRRSTLSWGSLLMLLFSVHGGKKPKLCIFQVENTSAVLTKERVCSISRVCR